MARAPAGHERPSTQWDVGVPEQGPRSEQPNDRPKRTEDGRYQPSVNELDYLLPPQTRSQHDDRDIWRGPSDQRRRRPRFDSYDRRPSYEHREHDRGRDMGGERHREPRSRDRGRSRERERGVPDDRDERAGRARPAHPDRLPASDVPQHMGERHREPEQRQVPREEAAAPIMRSVVRRGSQLATAPSDAYARPVSQDPQPERDLPQRPQQPPVSARQPAPAGSQRSGWGSAPLPAPPAVVMVSQNDGRDVRPPPRRDPFAMRGKWGHDGFAELQEADTGKQPAETAA